jgi:hypothetical protein
VVYTISGPVLLSTTSGIPLIPSFPVTPHLLKSCSCEKDVKVVTFQILVHSKNFYGVLYFHNVVKSTRQTLPASNVSKQITWLCTAF